MSSTKTISKKSDKDKIADKIRILIDPKQTPKADLEVNEQIRLLCREYFLS